MRATFDLTVCSDFLKTTADVNQLLGLLTTIADNLYKTTLDLEMLVDKQAPYEIASALKQLAQTHAVQIDDKTEAELFLRHLKEAIVSLPVVEVTLAFAPKRDLLEELSDWFSINYRTLVLFNIKVDPSIIAGAVFAVNGKFADYSLKKKISQMKEGITLS